MQTTRSRTLRPTQQKENVVDAKSNLKRKALGDVTNDVEASRAKRVAKATAPAATRKVAAKEPLKATQASRAVSKKEPETKSKKATKPDVVTEVVPQRELSPVRQTKSVRSEAERLSISDLQPMLTGMRLTSPAPAIPDLPEWNDIDADDRDDPQAVTEYVEDIFKHLKKKEHVDRANPNYMKSQTEISEKMRKVVVDWLVEVHLRFRVLTDTFFLAVNVMDRFLSLRQCPRSKLQLIAITSLLIASKFEEIYQPGLDDFVYICCKSFTHSEILKSEEIILQTLQYNLCNPTPLHFLRRYSKASHSNGKTHALSKYVAELSLLDYNMLKYLPSEIAAASVYLSRKWSGEEPWSVTLAHYTEYSEAQLTGCVADLAACVSTYGQAESPYPAIFKKYASSKLGEVAKIPLVRE